MKWPRIGYLYLLGIIVLAAGSGVVFSLPSFAQEAASPKATTVVVSEVTISDETFTVVELAISVDARGLLKRSDQARRDAVMALSPLLAPYAACEVEFGLIFGGGTGQEAIDTASLVAETLYLHFPDLSEPATFGRLSLNDPAAVDEVELTLFFYEDCAPASGTATPIPPASPSASRFRS